ncbi:MAG TPA: M3 family metallopeptidase [Galbitalea sp.]|nr:M3 family metallopeptidase [Galbitalea sp.]
MNSAKLQPVTLPANGEGWPSFVAAWADDNLEHSTTAIATLTDGGVRSAQEVLDLWNESELGLRNAMGFLGLLSEVHPDEAVRELAEERTQRVVKAATERGLNRELYSVLFAADGSGLDEQGMRLLEKVLLEFRRSGSGLEDAARDRLREISERTTIIDQDFSRAIRDDVRSIRVPVASLEGLPADYIDEHPADGDGLVTITTDYPDAVPFRMFSRDADARRALLLESNNRAWPGNDVLLGELLELRHEEAELLGYASWPDFDAEIKMVGSGAAIDDFIQKLSTSADAAGVRDRARLIDRRAQDVPGASTIDAADASYYSELVRRESYDVDSQELREYFDFQKVKQGLLDVTGRLLGLEYSPASNAQTWHEDVSVYDVVMDGERIGRIHLDLHPREGKYKHAAMFDITQGILGEQLAEGALVCNFSTGLMEHSDVTTLFHEFGHLVHHIVSNGQKYANFAGISTEWDFVEAPSQMLEEWAWDIDVLQTFAVNSAGEPIPAELVKRMRAADEFGNGLFVRTQTFYSAVSYYLHRDRPVDRTAAIESYQETYDLYKYVAGTHFQASFGHLTGYSSAYYTYMWSLVIAKDLFSAFDPSNLFDSAVATRYRDLVLAPGGSKDAAELVRDFLGREYSFDAFERWVNETP